MDEKHKEKIKNSVKKNWDNLKGSSAYNSRCKNMSKSKKGKLSPNKGRKYPALVGNKNALGNKPWNKGKGNKSLALRIRGSIKYKQWRSDVFQRDGWTCKTCNGKFYTMEAHHKKKFSKILEENNIKTFDEAMNCKELWDLDNGVTLCVECHDLTKCGKQEK